MNLKSPEKAITREMATDLFGEGSYTIEHREFSDGDTRTLIIHNAGWSSVDYVTVKVWTERGEVWVEYHEGDVRRCRETMPIGEYDADRDPMEYVYGSMN